MYVYGQNCENIYRYVYMYVCMCVCISKYICMYVCMCVHSIGFPYSNKKAILNSYIYSHNFVHIHTYILIYI